MATNKFGIPEIVVGQSQKEVTHNEGLAYIDALMKQPIIGEDTITPPVSPAEGDIHTVGVAATGVWSGQDGNMAVFVNSLWVFITPVTGWTFYSTVSSEELVYDGATWVSIVAAGIPLAQKGAASGVASLDANTEVVEMPAGAAAAAATDVLQANGSWVAPSGGGGGVSYIHLQQQEAQGTDAGTLSSAWTVRVLNTIVSDSGSILTSLTSNQFVLPAGTYIIDGTGPAFQCTGHRMRLYNITTANADLLGGTVRSASTDTNTTNASLRGEIIITVPTTFEVQHRGQSVVAGNGMGTNINDTGEVEVYTDIGIWKIA